MSRRVLVWSGVGGLLTMLLLWGWLRVFEVSPPRLVWDMYPKYWAAQQVLKGRNPYAPDLACELSAAMHQGRCDPMDRFWYPLYVVLFFLPLARLPLPWAETIYMTMASLGLLAVYGWTATLSNWPTTWREHGLLMIGWLGAFWVVWTLLLGQLALWSLLSVLAAVWFVQQGRDDWAGVCWSLALVKPQLMLMAWPGGVFWAWRQRRRSMLSAMLLTAALLLVIPLWFVPSWWRDFLALLHQYQTTHPFVSPLWRLWFSGQGIWRAVFGLLVLGLWLAGGYLWYRAKEEALLFTALGWNLWFTMWLLPQSTLVNQIALWPVLVWLGKRWSAASRIMAWLVVIVPGVLLWLLDLLPAVRTVGEPLFVGEHQVLWWVTPVWVVAWSVPFLGKAARDILNWEVNE